MISFLRILENFKTLKYKLKRKNFRKYLKNHLVLQLNEQAKEVNPQFSEFQRFLILYYLAEQRQQI
ncbi:hypothetical protein pb186bvf_005304 [Paramecium bursaria]